MYWSDVVDLGKELEEVIDFEVVTSFSFKKVFANKLSIKQQEHYNANKLGLKPEVAFEVRLEDYEGENIVDWNGARYYLYRTYDNMENGTVELYLSKEISDKNEY